MNKNKKFMLPWLRETAVVKKILKNKLKNESTRLNRNAGIYGLMIASTYLIPVFMMSAFSFYPIIIFMFTMPIIFLSSDKIMFLGINRNELEGKINELLECEMQSFRVDLSSGWHYVDK